MASLLVTGAAGFIGSNFVRYWRREHPSDAIVILDSLTYAGNLASLPDAPGIEFVEGDIRDTSLVRALLLSREVDTIVHLAAESHVDRSIAAPDAFVATNVVGTCSLLDAAKSIWLDRGTGRPHRFHHVSTDEVFGSLSTADPAFCETTRYAPNSPYAATKAASDHLVRAYGETYGMQTSISNCSNNYGPYQFPEKLIPLFVTNILEGRPLSIYGDGSNIRDWLHVDDHCRGIELILERGIPGQTYNVGGGAELSNLAVVEHICNAVDRAFAVDGQLALRFPDAPPASGVPSAVLRTFVADRSGHDRRYAIDGTKMRTELGYAPRCDFQSGLTKTVDWYLANVGWWAPLLSRAMSMGTTERRSLARIPAVA